MTEIDALLNEDRRFPPSADWRRDAIANDPDVYRRAGADPEAFWSEFARELDWIKPWSRVLEWNAPYAKWFVGGKLNISANCIDRHVRTARRNKAALIWEGEPGDRRTLTYWDLYRQVGAFANVLKSLGVAKGDRVALYMPMIPELAIAMLACARIGAIHSVDLRRVQRRGAAGPDQRRQRRAARDCRWRLPTRSDRSAQADGRRGVARHTVHQARDRRAAVGRRAHSGRRPGRTRPLVPPADAAGARDLRSRADGCGGHAVHPLHIGHNGKAEGYRPHHRRISCRHVCHRQMGLRPERR